MDHLTTCSFIRVVKPKIEMLINHPKMGNFGTKIIIIPLFEA
jgi:hypothetical protein